MKIGPDISLFGALIGDPARANMLTALMSGKALTAGELAAEAGVTAQTASSHLHKMLNAGLLQQLRQGRHRYFSLADEEVSNLLEVMMGLAAKKGHMRTRTGPKEPALREARVCYNHLAGDLGVRLYDSLLQQGYIDVQSGDLTLTESGVGFVQNLGIDLPLLTKTHPVLCKPCLDWSVRKNHLAGAVGTALLKYFYQEKWATRIEGTRIIKFSAKGRDQFIRSFPL